MFRLYFSQIPWYRLSKPDSASCKRMRHLSSGCVRNTKHRCQDCRTTCTEMCKECNKNKQNCSLQILELRLSTAAATFSFLEWKSSFGIPKPIWLINFDHGWADAVCCCRRVAQPGSLAAAAAVSQSTAALRIDKGVVCQVAALTHSLATLTCPSLGEPLPKETDGHLCGNPTPRVDERRCAHNVLTAPPVHQCIIPLQLPRSILFSPTCISLSPFPYLNGWVPSLWSLRSLVDRWMCRYANGWKKLPTSSPNECPTLALECICIVCSACASACFPPSHLFV